MTQNSFTRLPCQAFCLGWFAAVSLASLPAADSGSSVLVLYNSRVPESKEVAEYYAQKRGVPASQVLGLDLPATEAMTRSEYLEQLQNPLLKNLEANKLFVFAPAPNPGSEPLRKVIGAKIRYAALCYGVPTKILRDTNLVEAGAEKLPPELRRNEAAVDSQLACSPLSDQKLMWAGPMVNPFYGTTNASLLHPTNGILLVTRLDGPSAAIAKALVDKALQAEANGLWGRAYFDARGMTNGEYKVGDDMIRNTAVASANHGFDTVVDNAPSTFAPGFPMSQIAFYAGWYDGTVSGPFTRPKVEFMPGAFAYHLHSYSASTLRTPDQYWVGPLLQKGATATMGCVDEPYLTFTPDMLVFFQRFVPLGFSYGEAAYAAQNCLSWQTTVVGDPLYRPCAKPPDLLLRELEQRQDPLAAWSYLRVVNQAVASGAPLDEAIGYLHQLPLTKRSAVLTEKLGDLYLAKKQISDAMDIYDLVLKLDPTPQQKIRVMLGLGQRRTYYGPDRAAFDIYDKFVKEFPDYPDLLAIYQKLLPLAKKLDQQAVVERCEQEIKRLNPAPAQKS
jgi:uncharacterized protein (TIGR03790 family)